MSLDLLWGDEAYGNGRYWGGLHGDNAASQPHMASSSTRQAQPQAELSERPNEARERASTSPAALPAALPAASGPYAFLRLIASEIGPRLLEGQPLRVSSASAGCHVTSVQFGADWSSQPEMLAPLASALLPMFREDRFQLGGGGEHGAERADRGIDEDVDHGDGGVHGSGMDEHEDGDWGGEGGGERAQLVALDKAAASLMTMPLEGYGSGVWLVLSTLMLNGAHTHYTPTTRTHHTHLPYAPTPYTHYLYTHQKQKETHPQYTHCSHTPHPCTLRQRPPLHPLSTRLHNHTCIRTLYR